MNDLAELINKLESIEKQGFVPSLRKGDTGVGYTLETLLGIKENRGRGPDWGEYEIKAKRNNKSNNSSLFVPDWKYIEFRGGSKRESEQMIVEALGEPYEDRKGVKKGKALLHGAPYKEPEKHGWRIEFDGQGNLVMYFKTKTIASVSSGDLSAQFLRKMNKVIWVCADHRYLSKGCEEFHYNEAYLLETPSYDRFLEFIKIGKIVVELRMYSFTKHPDGKKSERHGNALRIREGFIFELYDSQRRIL